MIAEALNISRAEVHGVVTFYHDFRHQPAGRHVLKLCRAEACQSMGGDALAAQARSSGSASAWHETTADGAVTLEPVYCLGLCACAPSAMLDGEVVGRLDAERLDALSGGGAAMSVTPLSCRAIPARLASAPTRSPASLADCSPHARLAVDIVRTGSRGLYWLEPLVEVETPMAASPTARSVRATSIAVRCRPARRRRPPAAARRPEDLPSSSGRRG